MGDQQNQQNIGNRANNPIDDASSPSKFSAPISSPLYRQSDQSHKQSKSSPSQASHLQFHNQFQQPQATGSSQRFNEQSQDASHQAANFMNLKALSGTLPEVGYAPNYQMQPSHIATRGGPMPSGFEHQAYQNPQYPAQNLQYVAQYQNLYGPQQQQQQQQRIPQQSLGNPQQYYQHNQQSQQIPPYYYQQGQFTGTPPFSPVYQQASFGRNTYLSDPSTISGLRSNDILASTGTGTPGLAVRSSSITSLSSSGQASVPRGPPRKPKQSGHALWVGNLPPSANVVDLKDHFSRDATEDILSVFLISKSNCAFVNYRTEQSCAAAMARFHDSRFRDTRLVCRLRRPQVSGVPTGPSSPGPQTSSSPQPDTALESSSGEALSPAEVAKKAETAQDRYFIVKSLTVEDLELSVRNGQWATQSHNEETLNKAYESAESVFLIFSANKSGEYFGYAKMTSRINEDPTAAIAFAPKAPSTIDSDQPKAIPTLATEFAPKGRIIDDSARGTIFWEAETGDDDASGEGEDDQPEDIEDDAAGKAWGKPFHIEWMSTNRLPFYRTRGLRNPWNSNREVKIARDGTELETSIGRRLVQMFVREQVSAPQHMPVVPMPQMGYPPMRQY